MVKKEEVIQSFKIGLEKAMARFKEDASTLRTSRPSPALVENILVECYGTRMFLKEVATISVEPPNSLIIQPWDKANLQPVERALLKSDLGVSVAVDGAIIRLNFPPLSAERREELAKILRKKAEETRIIFRTERDEARKNINEMFMNKTISEDEKFKMQEEIQKIFDDFQTKLQLFLAEREKEIISL
jgi:ribosome recycling factor